MLFRRADIVLAAAISSTLVSSSGLSGFGQTRTSLVIAVTMAESLRPVLGLRATDFSATIDGRTAPVSAISAAPLTLSIVLLFDISASANSRFLEPPQDFTSEVDANLLSHLAPADRFASGVFGDNVSISGFSAGDRRSQLAAVRQGFKNTVIGRNGPSRIWDAVDSAVTALADQPGRRAIILVTDGQASGNRLGLAAVIKHAQAADVAVCVVASGSGFIEPLPPQRSLLTPYDALIRLASETGGTRTADAVGDTFRPRHPERFFGGLLDVLRNSYVLEIDAPAISGLHTVEVRVASGAQAHVRSAFTIGAR
jgi:hypothetical protein